MYSTKDEAYDHIFSQLTATRFFCASKDTPEVVWHAVEELEEAYGLIYETHQRGVYKLSAEGHKAVKLGSFQAWIDKPQSPASTQGHIVNVTGYNNNVIQTGAVSGSINQSINQAPKTSGLETASWIAGILGTIKTLLF